MERIQKASRRSEIHSGTVLATLELQGGQSCFWIRWECALWNGAALGDVCFSSQVWCPSGQWRICGMRTLFLCAASFLSPQEMWTNWRSEAGVLIFLQCTNGLEFVGTGPFSGPLCHLVSSHGAHHMVLGSFSHITVLIEMSETPWDKGCNFEWSRGGLLCS